MTLRGAIHGQLTRVGHWLGERGYRSASAKLYSLMAQAEPDGATAEYYRIQALIQADRIEAAIGQLPAVLQEHPAFAYGYFQYGWLLQQADRDSDAVEAFDRALELDPSIAAWHAARGFSLLRLERLSEAEASLRRALRHDERCTEALFNLGVLLMRADRFGEAITSYRAALAIEADTDASCNLAYLLEGYGRFADAERVVREALRHDPHDPTLASHLASVLHRQGRTPDAMDVLRSAETRTPDDFAVLSTLVEVLVETGHHQEGLAAAQRLSKSHPDAAAQGLLGWAHLEAGNAPLALDILDAALAASQDDDDSLRADVRGIRAAALAALGRHAEADAIFVELERQHPQVFIRNADLREYAARTREHLAGPPG